MKIGQTLSWTALNRYQQGLHFNVGRHGTEEVAAFWDREIGKDRNTMYSKPGKLNFAFIGDFTITVPYKTTGYVETSIKEIGLGQCKNGLSNNWWFGGKSCRHLSKKEAPNGLYYTVECAGTIVPNKQDPEAYLVKLYFKIGGKHAVNTVDFVKLDYC